MKFKIKTLSLALISILVFSMSGCQQESKKNASNDKEVPATTLTISAAASLTQTMEELKALYIKGHPNVNIVYNFGGSGSLQQQIEQGAGVDIFLSAAQKQMNTLDEKNLLLEDSRINLLQNNVVLITPKAVTDITNFHDVTGDKINKIALGEPNSVPAGEYAEEVFTKLGIIDEVKSKSVYAKNVREVLTWIESGNADAGVVYETDAKSSDKITIVAQAPANSHKPVLYPVSIIKNSKNIDDSREFIDFLLSSEAKTIYEKYGFTFVGK